MSKVNPKHHYLPQFYLGGFTPSGRARDLFWVFDRSGGKLRRGSPRSEAVIRGFYSADVAGETSGFVEDALAQIESASAPVISSIVRTHQLPSDSEIQDLLAFIALLDFRVPAARLEVEAPIQDRCKRFLQHIVSSSERFESVMRRIDKESDTETGEPVNIETMRAFVQRDEYRIEVPQTFLLELMLRSVSLVSDLLRHRKWRVVVMDTPGFICSDRPVRLSWSSQSQTDPPGFVCPGTIVTVPLDRHTALVGTLEVPNLMNKPVETMAAWINTRTILGATRFLYSPSSTFTFLMDGHRMASSSDLIACCREESGKGRGDS